MSKLKSHVKLMEKHRVLVNNLPQVVAKKERQSIHQYDTAPFDGPVIECPVWWQGERLAEELTATVEKFRNDHETLEQQHAEKMAKMVQEHEELLKQSEMKLADHMSSTSSSHKEKLQMLQTVRSPWFGCVAVSGSPCLACRHAQSYRTVLGERHLFVPRWKGEGG